ncbi:MAG: hypothetical protein HC802_11480 [Caldilineaceae bacterium]|nr:hypothetical protein [Caldilineaceae bacterium]
MALLAIMCVHMLDMTRWMLNLGWPQRISSSGGILIDKASKANITDTQTATFDFPDFPVIWQHRSYGHPPDPQYPWGMTIYGDKGTLKAGVMSYDFIPMDKNDKPIHKDVTYEFEQYPIDRTEKDLERHVAPAIRGHMRDLLRCIDNRSRPVADIEEGHISSASCILWAPSPHPFSLVRCWWGPTRCSARCKCPNCGTRYTVPVFTIIDFGANPELKGALLGGQINVASCTSCGAGGALNAPLLVNDPENQFLGVYAPADPRSGDAGRQKIIGELTQTLMRKLPKEERRGYMLQAKQFLDWQHFMEAIWGTEGVTPEMLRRQRDQGELLQRLMGLANDPSALKIAVERGLSLVDREFFSLLEQFMMMARSQGQAESAQALNKIRTYLLDSTETGKQVKAQQERIRGILGGINASTTREEMLSIVVDNWKTEDGEQVVGALAMAAAPLLDYQFLMLLADRIDQAEEDEQEQLESLREFLLEIQEEVAASQQQRQQASFQHVQALLQEVLQSNDTLATLQAHADDVDELFLSALAANIQAAEEKKATAAARRMRTIYQQALSVMQENLPAELRFLNELVSAPDQATTRRLLQENRALVTKEFLEALTPLEEEMREAGREEIANRIKSVRGQVALMV